MCGKKRLSSHPNWKGFERKQQWPNQDTVLELPGISEKNNERPQNR